MEVHLEVSDPRVQMAAEVHSVLLVNKVPQEKWEQLEQSVNLVTRELLALKVPKEQPEGAVSGVRLDPPEKPVLLVPMENGEHPESME